MKLKWNHGYAQHKRLKHERAINKYRRNLQEKNTTTNFITIVIYYITKNLQINLILKVSSPHRESLREDDQIFSKVLKVGCVHGQSSAAFASCPSNPYNLCTKFSFFHLQWFVILCTKSVLSRYDITVIPCDKKS